MGTHPIFESDFDCLTVMIFIFAVSAIGISGLKFQNFGSYGNSNFGISDMGFNDVQETHGHKSLTNVKPMGEDDWVTEKSIEKLLTDIGSTRWILQNFKDTENHQIDEDFDIAVKLFDNLELETNELLGRLN